MFYDLKTALRAAGPGLEPVEVDEVLGIKAQVEPVVAQESLRVDRPRQVAVLAGLEGLHVSGPDLRVALDAGDGGSFTVAPEEPFRASRR